MQNCKRLWVTLHYWNDMQNVRFDHAWRFGSRVHVDVRYQEKSIFSDFSWYRSPTRVRDSKTHWYTSSNLINLLKLLDFHSSFRPRLSKSARCLRCRGIRDHMPDLVSARRIYIWLDWTRGMLPLSHRRSRRHDREEVHGGVRCCKRTCSRYVSRQNATGEFFPSPHLHLPIDRRCSLRLHDHATTILMLSPGYNGDFISARVFAFRLPNISPLTTHTFTNLWQQFLTAILRETIHRTIRNSPCASATQNNGGVVVCCKFHLWR